MTKNSIVSFLCNPIKVGAYCARVSIPREAIIGLWEFLSVKAKEKRKRFTVKKPELNREFYEIIRTTGIPEYIDKTIDDMLNFLIKLDVVCPVDVKKWAEHGDVVVFPKYYEELPETEGGFFFFAPMVYFRDIQDALSIKIDYGAIPDFVMECASLTPKALSIFKSFITSIPCFNSKILYKDEGKRHSKRHVLDLYPAVAALWIDEFAHKDISRDLIDFISGAVDYIDKREWRMSILLSTFSVETLLSDIYEDLLKEEAPQAPIGFLIQEINKVKHFPPDAMRYLKILNKMRKAAAHRGTISFTQNDATLALMNAIQFILWYSFNGKNFCTL